MRCIVLTSSSFTGAPHAQLLAIVEDTDISALLCPADCRCAFAVGGGVSSTAVPVLVRYVNGTILPATTPLPPGATYGWWFFPGWAIFPCVAVCLVVAVLVWVSLERPARAAISQGVSTSGLGTALTQDNVAPCSDVVQPAQVAATAPAPAPLGPIVEMA